MGLLTHYIRDDRGRKVPAVNIFGVGIKQYCHDDFTLKDMKRLRRDVHFRSKSIWICGLAGGGHALVYQAFGWSPWFRSLQPTLRWSLLAGFALVFASTLIILLTKVRSIMDAGIIRSGFLEEMRCASCAYTIADVTPEQDGCRVCRECGAAWKPTGVIGRRSRRCLPRLTDDRGRRVVVLDLFGYRALGKFGDSFTAKDFCRLLRENYHRSRTVWVSVGWWLFAFVIISLVYGSRWFQTLTVVQRWLLIPALMLAAGLVGIGGILRLSGVFDSKLVKQILLRDCHCPSCAYSIREIAPDSDRCVVCPECGAAWRLKDASA